MKIQKPISIEKKLSKAMFWIVALLLILSIFYSNSLAFQCQIFTFYTKPSHGKAPLEVLFHCYAYDCDVPIAKYWWDFGDGSEVKKTTDNTIEHIYQNPGTYYLTVTVVDNEGNPIKTSEPKEISVGLSSLPGDCNDNGQVTIGEVQSCINCFLGIKNDWCSKCDLDDDGRITIDEVQKVINASLGLY